MKNRSNLNNLPMTTTTYEARQRVISIIRQCLVLNRSLPRVEIRIVENNGNTLGRALLYSAVPHISITHQVAFSKNLDLLTNVVLHELCHTWFDAPHDETCPLMRSTIDTKKPLSKLEAFSIFKKYLNEYKTQL